MKKHKIIITMILMCVLLFGSVITTHAAVTGARATRTHLTTNDGNVVAFADMDGYDTSSLKSYATDAYRKYNKYAIVSWIEADGTEGYFVIFTEHDGVNANSELVVDTLESTGKFYPRIKDTRKCYIEILARYNPTENKWTVKTGKNLVDTSLKYYTAEDIATKDSSDKWLYEHLVYSSDPVYTDASLSMVFFQAPKVVLAPVVGEIPLKGATAQILMMMPICLALLVGYLGLRKALSILQTILHQA